MDMRALMKQAQKMQQQMAETQEKLATREVEVEVGGGQVAVRMNGKHELLDLRIKAEVVDPADIEFLQDMILSAVNEAIRKVDAMVEQEMGAVTGGLNIPGMPGL